MAKAQDGPAPISEESIGYLEEVKKGKPRKFAMICKGTSVVSLVVYKKGNVEKRRKEAKESGKGQFYFGVVDGKGMDIRFVLARADGFESAPVKTAVLKSFLDESAELKCKPYFEIVDAAPFVHDEDDPLVARFLKLREKALQACEAHPDRAAEINGLCMQIGSYFEQDQLDPATANLDTLETLLGSLGGAASSASPQKVDDGLAAKLIEALKNLKPLLEKAIALHPNRKAELITSFTQVRDEIKNQQFTQAQSSFVGLEKLLQSLVASPVASNSESQSPVSDEMAQWKEKVAAWGPAIKTAIAAKGPNAAEMMKLLAQASALSKPGGDLVQAITKLTECYTLVTTSAPVDDPGALFSARLKALIPEIKALAGTPIGDEAKTLASQAGGFAGKKDFVPANQLMDRVQALLAKGHQTEAPSDRQQVEPRGVVAYAKLLLEWRAAQQRVATNISAVGRAILAREDVRADPRFEQVRAAVAAMPTLVPAFGEELNDLIDAAMNAGSGPKADESLDKARGVVARYRVQLNAAATLARLEKFAEIHSGTESDVFTALDAALALLEREFAARTTK